jgi:anti-anti-sigma factor
MNISEENPFELLLHNQVGLIKMPPTLTIHQAQPFKDYFEQLCRKEPPLKTIILDFGQTTFLDSSGLGALIRSLNLAKKAKIQWSCWSFSPDLKYLFELAGMGSIFTMELGSDAVFFPKSSSELLPIGQFAPSEATTIHPAYASKLKRGIDIIGSLVGLGITGILFIPIAIAIKLDNPGPIFFRQNRQGYMGKPFWVWKFRSMVANAESLKYQVANQAEGNFFKSENDPRITRVGKILRKTSLDEFPQFWNVFLGDMSLVGTRPPTYEEVSNYDLKELQRLNVKPGITGEWQVNGRSKIKDFDEVVRLDLKYQRNWSLLYDLKILFKTIKVIFSKDSGAY